MLDEWLKQREQDQLNGIDDDDDDEYDMINPLEAHLVLLLPIHLRNKYMVSLSQILIHLVIIRIRYQHHLAEKIYFLANEERN